MAFSCTNTKDESKRRKPDDRSKEYEPRRSGHARCIDSGRREDENQSRERPDSRCRAIGGANAHASGQLNVALNTANVLSQANCAAAGSKRGVVSLLKPCCVPG